MGHAYIDCCWQRVQTLDLFMQGRDAWNAHALAQTATRLELMAKGRWDDGGRTLYDMPDVLDAATSRWFRDSSHQFSNVHFHPQPDMGQTFCPLPLTHPARTDTARAQQCILHARLRHDDPYPTGTVPSLRCPVHLHLPAATFDIRGFLFAGNVGLVDCTVHGDLLFDGCDFLFELEMSHLRVLGDVRLDGCRFFWMLHMNKVCIGGHLRMRDTCFFELLEMLEVDVGGDLDLSRALFTPCCWHMEHDVRLWQVNVAGVLRLRGAHGFNRATCWTGRARALDLRGARFAGTLRCNAASMPRLWRDARTVFCRTPTLRGVETVAD